MVERIMPGLAWPPLSFCAPPPGTGEPDMEPLLGVLFDGDAGIEPLGVLAGPTCPLCAKAAPPTANPRPIAATAMIERFMMIS